MIENFSDRTDLNHWIIVELVRKHRISSTKNTKERNTRGTLRTFLQSNFVDSRVKLPDQNPLNWNLQAVVIHVWLDVSHIRTCSIWPTQAYKSSSESRLENRFDWCAWRNDMWRSLLSVVKLLNNVGTGCLLARRDNIIHRYSNPGSWWTHGLTFVGRRSHGAHYKDNETPNNENNNLDKKA